MASLDARELVGWIARMLDLILVCAQQRAGGPCTEEIVDAALLRGVEILGEAVKCLPTDFRTAVQAEGGGDIDWRGLIGLRDILAHAYHRIDMDIVWATVYEEIAVLRNNLPVLKAVAGV